VELRTVKRRKRRAPLVAASPRCAVSRISKSAGHPNATVRPTWKSVIQQVGNLCSAIFPDALGIDTGNGGLLY
jgi:hypothetical protein